MKICLVHPGFVTTVGAVGVEIILPLGVTHLAGYLRQCGHEVSFIDAIGEGIDTLTPVDAMPGTYVRGLTAADIAARIPEDTAVIGVSCMMSTNWVAHRHIIQAIRRRFPQATLIIGGEHATALPEYCLRDAGVIDFVVLGEGENTTDDLLNALDKGTDPTLVPGLGFLRDGAYAVSSKRLRERQVDGLSWPAWDLVPVENYFKGPHSASLDSGRTFPIIASRGCPYECTFCSSPAMWGRLWRPRKPQNVVDEIEHYVRQYNIDHIDFWDLTLIVKRSWIVAFCEEMIARKLRISWQIVTTRSEAIDSEVAHLLKKAGCNFITYAPESGSDQVLADIRKKVNKEAMLTSIAAAVDAGMGAKLSYVLGFPDDRLVDVFASYWMAIRAAWRGAHDATFFAYFPYPGSELFDRLVNEGKIHINDEYFFGLAVYNLHGMKSSARNFNDTQLRWLCIVGMALFYMVSFTRRPLRFLRLVDDLIRERGRTKLAAALVRFRKNARAMRRAADRQADSGSALAWQSADDHSSPPAQS